MGTHLRIPTHILDTNQGNRAFPFLTLPFLRLQDTEREIVATEHRVTALERQRTAVSEAVASADAACQQLRGAEEALRLETVSAVNNRYGLLLATARAQRTTKRLEVRID